MSPLRDTEVHLEPTNFRWTILLSW